MNKNSKSMESVRGYKELVQGDACIAQMIQDRLDNKESLSVLGSIRHVRDEVLKQTQYEQVEEYVELCMECDSEAFKNDTVKALMRLKIEGLLRAPFTYQFSVYFIKNARMRVKKIGKNKTIAMIFENLLSDGYVKSTDTFIQVKEELQKGEIIYDIPKKF